MADSRIPADVNDAVYRLVREFGAEKLAEKTGTPAGTIYNKANPNDTGHHKPTLSDGILWTNITGDMRIATAFSRAVGGVFVDLRGMDEHSDAALLDLILLRGVEEGKADRVLSQALGDGRISRAEFERIRKEELEVVSSRLTVLFRIEGMVCG